MSDLIAVFPDRSYIQISVLLDKALDCPQCFASSKSLIIMSEKIVVSPRYLIACRQCCHKGPFGKHIRDAVDQWNKPPGLFARLMKFLGKKQNRQRLSPAQRVFGG